MYNCVHRGVNRVSLEKYQPRLVHKGDTNVWKEILQEILPPPSQIWIPQVITMVFVKVRETYDLNTVLNKMSVLAIHTPKADIIKKCYPGLLMQCKAYRPVSVDIKCACASVVGADPLQVGTATGDIAPEDLFNPILYKAVSNQGMSQIEARINHFQSENQTGAFHGESVDGVLDGVSAESDEFDLFYGLLADTHSWKHANPQQGFVMQNVKPLVYEMLYSMADNAGDYNTTSGQMPNAGRVNYPNADGSVGNVPSAVFRGNGKPMPFINCVAYDGGDTAPGFEGLVNGSTTVPAPSVVCACVIIPPCRMHQLFYRMVVEWTLEFSQIRQISEITTWGGLANLGQSTHYKSYDYDSAKAVAGVEKTNLVNDVCMASANVDIKKVM